jgi:hypothetical protein
MPWWWPFKKRVFKKLETEADCVEAVRALVVLSIQQSSMGQLGAIAQCGRVIQLLKGEVEAKPADEFYLRAFNELLGKPEIVVPAMCHVLLNVVGPEKGWATLLLQQIGKPAAPEVARRLAEAGGDMRTHLIGVLEKIGDPGTKGVLETVAKETGKVGEAARGALERMNAPA